MDEIYKTLTYETAPRTYDELASIKRYKLKDLAIKLGLSGRIDFMTATQDDIARAVVNKLAELDASNGGPPKEAIPKEKPIIVDIAQVMEEVKKLERNVATLVATLDKLAKQQDVILSRQNLTLTMTRMVVETAYDKSPSDILHDAVIDTPMMLSDLNKITSLDTNEVKDEISPDWIPETKS